VFSRSYLVTRPDTFHTNKDSAARWDVTSGDPRPHDAVDSRRTSRSATEPTVPRVAVRVTDPRADLSSLLRLPTTVGSGIAFFERRETS
jgi:hypothetical protein